MKFSLMIKFLFNILNQKTFSRLFWGTCLLCSWIFLFCVWRVAALPDWSPLLMLMDWSLPNGAHYRIAMHVPSSAVRREREERREVPIKPGIRLSDILRRIQTDLESQSVNENKFECRSDGLAIEQFPWADLPAELQVQGLNEFQWLGQ